MPSPRLSKLELRIMDALWAKGPSCVRDILDAFPAQGRPAYTTVQTTVYRMERKGYLRRARKISNAHIFEALITREATQRRLIDDLLDFVGGGVQPVMARLIETGRLTMDDVKEAQKTLRAKAKKEQPR